MSCVQWFSVIQCHTCLLRVSMSLKRKQKLCNLRCESLWCASKEPFGAHRSTTPNLCCWYLIYIYISIYIYILYIYKPTKTCLAWLLLHPSRPYNGILYHTIPSLRGNSCSFFPNLNFHIPLMPSEHPAANDRVSLGIKPNLLAMSWFSLSPNVEMPILPIRISLPDLAATFASPLKASALSLLAQTLHVLEQSNEWQISKQQTNKQTNTHTHKNVLWLSMMGRQIYLDQYPIAVWVQLCWLSVGGWSLRTCPADK